jgi:DNA repair protein RecO (recombination protein O)
VLRFEMLALRLLGHLPSLDTCVDCGADVPMTGRVAFGQLDGGVLCPRCRTGKRQLVSVSAGALRAIKQLGDPVGPTWRRLKLDARTRGELRGLLNGYVCNLLGRKPRMHDYLSMLSS